MEKFQVNEKYYDKPVESFSSADEFDAKKRVQITNEIPPMDMFDMAHSLIKNDLWKWFFGWSTVMNDIDYSAETNGAEIVDQEGQLQNVSIAKYVNGIRAKNYGPLPKKIWNPNWEKDWKEYSNFIGNEQVDNPLTEDDFKYKIEYPKARRIEISGTLLPEVDLMLHEAYRYLSVLYPDHPDFSKLLTYNEFEDEINQAAALIDYVPDHEYFNWLSRMLPYENYSNDAVLQETSMMKIRNLTNHAMRRKFFGSKTGYKMMGSDIFQHVAVIPAAQVIPFKETDELYQEDEVDFKWLRAFEKRDDFKDGKLDKSHVLYKKRVRLLDWTNETYDFPGRWVPPAEVIGTAWPTPYSQFILYEYPLQKVIDQHDFEELKDGLSTTRTMKRDFHPGQKIHIGEAEGHIAALREEDTYKVEVSTSSKETRVHVNPDTLTVVDIDFPVQPIYTQFTCWPSLREMVGNIAAYETGIYDCKECDLPAQYSKRLPQSLFYEHEDLLDDYIACDSLLTASDALRSVYYQKDVVQKLEKAKYVVRQPREIDLTPDPHQDGCFFLSPEIWMTLFEDELNINLDTSCWDEPVFYDKHGNPQPWPESTIEYGVTNMSDEGVIKKGDVLDYNGHGKRFMTQVLGLSNAWIQFKFNTGNVFIEQLQKSLDRAKNADTSRYGLVMKLSSNNPEGGGQLVVFYGTPIFGEPELSNPFKRYYVASSVFFNIKAIPRVKSHAACRAIYGTGFAEACKVKYHALEALIGIGDGKSAYSLIKKDLDAFEAAWKNFETAATEMIDAASKNNLLFRDSHWKKLNKTSAAFVALFEKKRPILQKQLDFLWNDWHKVNDVSFEKLPPLEVIKQKVTEIFAEFKRYYEEYHTWEIEEAAIDPETEFYQRVFNQSYGARVDLKNQVIALQRADDLLMKSMLPNRAFLITPLPEDLLMRTWPDQNSSYTLLTGQDEFETIIEFEKSPFDDMILQKMNTDFALPGGGLLNNVMSYSYDAWNFGSLNTATIVETSWDPATCEYVTADVVEDHTKVDFIDEYYHSSEAWIQHYETEFPNVIALKLEEDGISKEEYDALPLHDKEHYYLDGETYHHEIPQSKRLPYWSMNDVVQEIYDNDDSSHRFAYGDPNMMEMFLED